VYGTRYATDRQAECRLHDLEVALKIELRRQKRKDFAYKRSGKEKGTKEEGWQ
jgi:hypothetical protein